LKRIHLARSGQAVDVFGIAINVTVFLYIVSVFIAGHAEGWSKFSISFAGLLWILLGIGIRLKDLSVTKLQVLPWIFCGYTLFSIVWARNTDSAVDTELQAFSAILGGTGIWMAIRNGLSQKTIPWAMLVGSIILMISGYGQIGGGGVVEGRVDGLTGNANALAIFLSYAAFTIWLSAKYVPKWMPITGCGLIAYAVLFTGSRKSLMVLTVAILWLIPLIWRWLNVRINWAWLPIITMVLIAASLFARHNFSQLEETLSSVSSIQRFQVFWNRDHPVIRENLVASALELWQKSPIIGHGAGQFLLLANYGLYSHNNYTELLANYGLIGLLLYYALPLALVVIVFRRIHQRKLMDWHIGLLILTTLSLDMAMVSFYSKISNILWAIIAALVTESPSAILPRISTLTNRHNRFADYHIGAVVTRSIPPHSIAAGRPTRVHHFCRNISFASKNKRQFSRSEFLKHRSTGIPKH